jgi:hypothetical protein
MPSKYLAGTGRKTLGIGRTSLYRYLKRDGHEIRAREKSGGAHGATRERFCWRAALFSGFYAASKKGTHSGATLHSAISSSPIRMNSPTPYPY